MSQQSDNCDNPYLAPVTMSQPPFETVEPGNLFWLKMAIGLQFVVIVAGLAASLIEIESIIATGPILSIVGLLVALLSFRRRFPGGVLLGCSGLVISVVVCLTIILLDWSPAEARLPVPIIGGGYLGLAGPFVITWLSRVRAREAALQSPASAHRQPLLHSSDEKWWTDK